MVEAAVVLGAFLLILLAMLDLGLAALRDNVLSEAARRLAREASLHGEKAAPRRSTWGPEPYLGSADDGSEFAAAIAPVLVAVDPSELRIAVLWPDGGNETDRRVRVTLNYDHDCLVPYLYGKATLRLQAVSTMRIEH